MTVPCPWEGDVVPISGRGPIDEEHTSFVLSMAEWAGDKEKRGDSSYATSSTGLLERIRGHGPRGEGGKLEFVLQMPSWNDYRLKRFKGLLSTQGEKVTRGT